MRGWVCGMLVAGLTLTTMGSVRADEQADGRAVVDKAIKAAGGTAKLAKFQAASLKGKGVAQDAKEITFTFEASAPDLVKARLELEATVDGNAIKMLAVITKDNAWAKHMDKVEELPEEIRSTLQADLYALRLAQQLVPLTDKAFKLSPLGEAKVADRPALGIKVAHKDHPDVDLYFDKEKGHVVKCETRVKDMPGGTEVPHEFLFSDFKETDGIQHFMKVTLNRDGKKLFEAELSEAKPEEKLDDNLFVKP